MLCRSPQAAVGVAFLSAACSSFGSNTPIVSDAGVTDAAASNDATPDGGSAEDTRYVFVTSERWTGNLGGIPGADAKCQDVAQRAGALPVLKGRTFKALIAMGTQNAFSRFTRKASYVLLTTPPKPVASGFGKFTTELPNAIDIDEKGEPQLAGGSENVWSGTADDGTPGEDCDGWSDASTGATGRYGGTGHKGLAWIASGEELCSNQNRLYCVED